MDNLAKLGIVRAKHVGVHLLSNGRVELRIGVIAVVIVSAQLQYMHAHDAID